MATNKFFEQDDNTKEMLHQISSTFGVKQDIVKDCWEFTVFTMLLKIAEETEEKDGLIRITIPYIGTIGIRNKGMVMEKDGIVPDLEAFASLSNNFKNLFQKVQNGSYGELSDYLQSKYIEPVVDNISQQ